MPMVPTGRPSGGREVRLAAVFDDREVVPRRDRSIAAMSAGWP